MSEHKQKSAIKDVDIKINEGRKTSCDSIRNKTVTSNIRTESQERIHQSQLSIKNIKPGPYILWWIKHFIYNVGGTHDRNQNCCSASCSQNKLANNDHLKMSMSKPFSSQIMHFLEDGFFLSSHKPATRKTLDSGKVLFKTNPIWTASLKISRIKVCNATPVKLKKTTS